ncbi:MAG TPA: DUF4252 domain-containing protein [Thermoanaerobaculia bacterium]|nr:DUF4252 domain-containing protein [Thermoanaerobaculia bacterium]
MRYLLNRRSGINAPFLLGLLGAAALLTACSSTPSTDEVRWAIERQLPGARFERQDHLHLGRFTFGLVRWIAGFDHEPGDQKDLEILRAISGVEVATYKVRSLPPLDSLKLPENLEHRLHEAGWNTMVRSGQKDEQAWILYRGDSMDAIRDLYIVSLDQKELALVRVSGRLDRVIARAMADEPKKLAHLQFSGK